MKVWITANINNPPDAVGLFYRKPYWNDIFEEWHGDGFIVCRKEIRRLVRGSGTKLPRHGTKDLIEVELIARRPE